MVESNKNYIYALIAVVVIVVGIVIYHYSFNKQNYEEINGKKRVKHNIKEIKTEGSVILELMKKSIDGKIKIFHENKKRAQKIIKLSKQRGKKRAQKLRAEKSMTTTPIPIAGPNDLNDTLKRRIKECTLGRIYNLPAINIEDSTNFVKLDRRSVFKEYTPVGDEVSGGVRGINKTISDKAFLNDFITATRETSMLDGTYTYCSNTSSVMHQISSKTTASVGAAYSAVTASATFSSLSSTTTTSTSQTQAYNISVRKFSQSITLGPSYWNKDFINTEFLIDLETIGNMNLASSVKAVLDPGASGPPITLNGSENIDDLITKIPNTNIPETSWKLCNGFFKKWGSHIITSIDYGKKLNIWDTIANSTGTTENLLETKMCAQLSYGGFTPCTTKCEGFTTNYRENFDDSTVLPETGDIPQDQMDELLGNIDFDSDQEVSWDPVPARTSPPSTPDIITTTFTPGGGGGNVTTLSPGGITTLSPGGGGSKFGCNPCPSGKECIGYQPETADQTEIKGQCQVPGAPVPSLQAGAQICNAKRDYTKEDVSSQSSKSTVYLVGGSAQSQAAVMANKIGDSPKLDQGTLMDFLTSSEEFDVAVNFTFIPIWEMLEEIYGRECGARISGVGKYQVYPIFPSCYATFSDTDQNKIMSQLNFTDAINNGMITLVKDEKGNNYPIKVVYGVTDLTTKLVKTTFPYQRPITVDVDTDFCKENGERIPTDVAKLDCVLLTKNNEPAVYLDSDGVIVNTAYGKYVPPATTPPPSALKAYYNVFYYDPNTNTNTFELFCSSDYISRNFDPCNILQAAYNLEAAYVALTVCPLQISQKYGVYQKMIPLEIDSKEAGKPNLQQYACWNKVTGCQSDGDCIGSEQDFTKCSGFWSVHCDDVFSSCQQGGLWHETDINPILNSPNVSIRDATYRTVDYKPSAVPFQYTNQVPKGCNPDDPTSNCDSPNKYAQTSCLSNNSRFLPDGSITGRSRIPRNQGNGKGGPCYCQNGYIPNLPNNTFGLDKGSGSAAGEKSLPNILPNRFVWNQALGK
jgi:hypothetical protein